MVGSGLRKTIFSARVRFGRPRSSKVIDFGTNRKRICDFLLVRHNTRSPQSAHGGVTADTACAHTCTLRHVTLR